MEIRYSKTAAKALKSYDKPTRERIRDAIRGLTESPPRGDIKRLEGFSDGRHRLRAVIAWCSVMIGTDSLKYC